MTIKEGNGKFTGAVTNHGTISGGVFSGEVKNYGTMGKNAFKESKITGGVFDGTVINGCAEGSTYYSGIIQGGTFNGTVTNTRIKEGQVKAAEYGASDCSTIQSDWYGNSATFTADSTVKNSGSITAGTFEGAVTNQDGGTIAAGDPRNSGKVITSGTFSGTVTNESGATISGGTFTGEVTNSGSIEAGTVGTGANETGTSGTFAGTVTNASGGSIASGTFSETVTNASGATISGGSFSKAVTNSGTISGGTFADTVTNENGGSTAGTLTVTFALNDGSGENYAMQYCKSGAQATKPTTPTRTGYELAGWYKEADGMTAWNFETDTVTANLILYAQWTVKTGYSVTFASGVPEGEAAAAENMPESKSGNVSWTDTVLAADTAPKRTGYAFTGWEIKRGTTVSGTAEAGTAYTYADLAGTDDDPATTLTLTAQWKASTQPTGTITFKNDPDTYGPWNAFTPENAANPSVWVKPGTYTIEITGSADADETVTIEYTVLLCTEDVTETVLAEKTWMSYTQASTFEFAENSERRVIYAKLTGSTGLVTYLCSGGIVADGTAPVIAGVENGKTYCGSTKVTVTDANLDVSSVKVGEEPVTLSTDGSFTLSPKSGEQTIIATDKAGNETSVTVTVNSGHTYEWKNGDGKYWQECKVCGDKTAESAIPELTLIGANKVCRTQNAVLTFTLPAEVTLSTCRYGFAALAMQEITPVQNTDGSYTLTVSSGDYAEGATELKVTLEANMQGGSIPLTAEKIVTIQDEHSGGTATCKAEAVCEVCGVPYGELDASHHTGEEVWEKTAGAHRKYWSCCGADSVAAEAHEWSDGVCTECGYVCQHSGGTATCMEKAVCEVCGAAYGEPDVNHHTGGTATCQSGAVCERCGVSYGEKNASNHAGAESWEQTADTHRKYWSCCGADSVATEAHEWSDGACTECGYVCVHSGGTATCTATAVCEHCGASYGEKNAANHAHGLTKREAVAATVSAEGNTAYWYCADCGKYFSDAGGRTQITLASTVLAKLPPAIVAGEGQSVTAGGSIALTFRSNAPLADLLRVELDGNVVAPENYDKAEGSTIITLYADFVATLPVGEHTLDIVSEGGIATVSFAVAAAPASGQSAPAPTPTPEITTITPPVVQDPSTGDNSAFAGLLALVVLSGGAYVLFLVLRKRQEREAEK